MVCVGLRIDVAVVAMSFVSEGMSEQVDDVVKLLIEDGAVVQ